MDKLEIIATLREKEAALRAQGVSHDRTTLKALIRPSAEREVIYAF